MFICGNAEGAHGQRKVGNPWTLNHKKFSITTYNKRLTSKCT